MWQSTQRTYENGSTINQKEVIEWSVHLETMEKRYRDICDSHTKESEVIATECSLINDEDTFTWNLSNIHSKEKFHLQSES